MSKLLRVLALGTMLAATNLVGITAVAHADDQAAATHDSRQPPTERQVGEAWRHRQVEADQPTVAGNPRPPLERQVGESYRHHVRKVRPAEPSGQPGWLIPAIGVLAALALCSGLAVATTRRARRRVQARPAA